MTALQGRARESNVRLLLSGSPVTGIAYTAVTVKYRKMGDTSFSVKTLAAADWDELVNGFYILKWSEDDMDTLGPFLYEITGAGFDPVVVEFDIDHVPLSLATSQEKCVISGSVFDIGGDPDQGQRVMLFASAGAQLSNDAFVSSKTKTTTADLNGNFSIELLRGIKVIVEMQGAGIKHQITVPDQETALLVDLLPPI